MSQIVQVQSGKTQVRLPDLMPHDSLEKVLLTDREFDGLSADAFTSYLTDLGPGLLVKAVALSTVTEDDQVVASFTPGFAGVIRSFSAVVTTEVTTASKSASLGLLIDADKGTNAVQTMTKTGTVSGGTYTLTYDGQTTSAIARNAVAADIQTALEALSNVAPGDIIVTGGPASSTTPTVFTFSGALAGKPVALMTVDYTSITGGGSLAIANTTTGVQGSYIPTQTNGGVLALTSAKCATASTLITATNVKGTSTGPVEFGKDSRIDIITTANPTDFVEGAVLLIIAVEPQKRLGTLV